MEYTIRARANKREREISDQHLGEFKPQGSRGLAFINKLCQSERLTRRALVALAYPFSYVSGIPFRRDFSRRRDLVVKWFDDNIDLLEPLATVIQVAVEPLEPNSAKGAKYD
jgi:hypothetical protein